MKEGEKWEKEQFENLIETFGKSPIVTKAVESKKEPLKFPIVEIDTMCGNDDCGFGLKVWIDGKAVYAPQTCVVVASKEDFSMVVLKFPAIVKKSCPLE